MIRDGAIVILVGTWLAAMGYGAWLIYFDVRDLVRARRVDRP